MLVNSFNSAQYINYGDFTNSASWALCDPLTAVSGSLASRMMAGFVLVENLPVIDPVIPSLSGFADESHSVDVETLDPDRRAEAHAIAMLGLIRLTNTSSVYGTNERFVREVVASQAIEDVDARAHLTRG